MDATSISGHGSMYMSQWTMGSHLSSSRSAINAQEEHCKELPDGISSLGGHSSWRMPCSTPTRHEWTSLMRKVEILSLLPTSAEAEKRQRRCLWDSSWTLSWSSAHPRFPLDPSPLAILFLIGGTRRMSEQEKGVRAFLSCLLLALALYLNQWSCLSFYYCGLFLHCNYLVSIYKFWWPQKMNN